MSSKGSSVGNPFALASPRSAYVHVPFCASRCTYCDFYTCQVRKDDFQVFEQAIIEEIRQARENALCQFSKLDKLETLYFGGGTPSFLPLSVLYNILREIDLCFSLASDCEISLEANPAKNLPAKLPSLFSMGFNRLSMGLQSADNQLLKKLGRIHTHKDFLHSLEAAISAGFENISTDLIFGIPGQKLDSFLEEASELLALPISHLSYYSMQFEKGTPLGDYCLAHPEVLPGEEEERAMYKGLRSLLKEESFVTYEISNAAKAGKASKHNLVYWNAKPYYAFGPSAASYIGGQREHRIEDLDLWASKVLSADPSYLILDETIDGDEARAEYMMLRLRLEEGLIFSDYQALFCEDARERFSKELAELEQRGLIQVSGEKLVLTELGLDLENQVSMAFLS